MDTLVFRLYAPLASWGAQAVGEERPSSDCPGAGSILGLLAAALGIRREEEARQQALFAHCTFAVKTVNRGYPLRDYHTIQAPSARTGKFKHLPYPTRRAELGSMDDPNTLISRRDYRCDGLWVVALRVSPDSPVSLEQCRAALLRPAFPLYLGRKSCPPGAPLAPKIVQAETWRAALDTEFHSLAKSQKQQDYLLASDIDWKTQERRVDYQWVGEISDLQENIPPEQVQTLTLGDMPISRDRWQFRARQVRRWHTTEARS